MSVPTTAVDAAHATVTGSGGMRAWSAYLTAGLLAACAYLLLAGLAQDLAYDVIGGSAAVAIAVGARRYAAVRAPWYLIALSQLLFVAGDATYNVYEYVLGVPEYPFPSLADPLYLSGYGVVTAGLVLIIRRRDPRGDRATLLDSAIVACGVGVFSWTFLMAPIVRDASLALSGRVISMLYPLMDLMLLALAARLVLGRGARARAGGLLGLGLVALLVTDTLYALSLLAETYPRATPSTRAGASPTRSSAPPRCTRPCAR